MSARWSTRPCCSCWPARRPIDVPMVRAVGRAPSGDTMLGDRAGRGARSGRDPRPPVEPRSTTAHDAGLSPCSIDVDDLGWTSTGDGVLSGWSGGMTAPTEMQCLQDRAQLLVATTLISRARRGDRGRPRRARRRRGGRGAAVRAGVVGASRDASPRRRSRRHDRGPPERAVLAAGHRGGRSSSSSAGSRWAPSSRPRCSCSPARRSSARSPGSTSTRWPTRSRPSPWPAS